VNNRLVRLVFVIPVIVVISILTTHHSSPSKQQQAFIAWHKQYGAPMSVKLSPILTDLGSELTTLAGSPTNKHELTSIYRNCTAGVAEFRSVDGEPLPPIATIRTSFAELTRTATSLFSTCIVIFHGAVFNQRKAALKLFEGDISKIGTEIATYLSDIKAAGFTLTT
jgi:hypothetical protein